MAIASGLLHGGPTDVILATIPPRTSAVVAAALAGRLKARLVIDYRDPWMPVPGEPQMPPWRQRLDRALEGFCLRRAALVLATTEGLGRDLTGVRCVARDRGSNAFDPSLFDDIEAVKFGRFTVVYAGNLSGLRSAAPVLEAMKRLRQAGAVPQSGMALRILGAGGPETAAAAEHLGVGDMVEVEDFLPYREALSRIKGADALLLVVADSHAHLIPAKLFEYLAARRFVIALVPGGSDAGALVERLHAGVAIDPRDVGELAKVLEQRFSQNSAGIQLAPEASLYEEESTMAELDRHLRSVLTGR